MILNNRLLSPKTNRNRIIIYYLTYSIPLVLLFDWLFTLEFIPFPLGVLFKGITIVFNFNLFLTKRKKVGKFNFGKIISFFLLINIIYALFSDNIIQNLYLSIRILYWVSTTISVFYLLKNNLINVKYLKFIFVATSIIGSFFTIYLMSISVKHQNASAYLLLWCFPVLLLFKQTSLIRLVQVLAIISIVLTIKRGAIVALLISVIAYIVAYIYIERRVGQKMKILFVGFVFLFSSFVVIFNNQNKFSERLEDKTGSGRDIVYGALVDKYLSSDIDNLIFGYGFKGVEKYIGFFLSGNNEKSGPAAHSDWLQYMFDFGFFGILVMLLLHAYIISLLRINFKLRTKLFPIILMFYVIFFLTTIYSFILNVPDAIFFGITASIFAVESDRYKRNYYNYR